MKEKERGGARTNKKRYGELYKCRDFRYKRQRRWVTKRREAKTKRRKRAQKTQKTHPRKKCREQSHSVTQEKRKNKKRQSLEEPSLICLLLEKRGSLKKHIERTFGKLNKWKMDRTKKKNQQIRASEEPHRNKKHPVKQREGKKGGREKRETRRKECVFTQ